MLHPPDSTFGAVGSRRPVSADISASVRVRPLTLDRDRIFRRSTALGESRLIEECVLSSL